MKKTADICQVCKTRNNTTAPRRDFCSIVCARTYVAWFTDIATRRARD